MSFEILEFGSNGRYNKVEAKEIVKANLLVVLQRIAHDTVLGFFGRFRHFCLSLETQEPDLIVLKNGEEAKKIWKGNPPLNYMVVYEDKNVEVGYMGDLFLVGESVCRSGTL